MSNDERATNDLYLPGDGAESEAEPDRELGGHDLGDVGDRLGERAPGPRFAAPAVHGAPAVVDPSAYARKYVEPTPWRAPVVPAPEVTAREIDDALLPRNAKTLKAWADANGWRTQATYSRGPEINATNGQVRTNPVWEHVEGNDENGHKASRKKVGETQRPQAENVTIRFRKANRFAALIYLDGKFSEGWLHEPDGLHSVGVGLVKGYVMAGHA